MKVTAKALYTLLEAQGHRCALTGMELTPETVTCDHKLPVARGGTHDIENIQLLHHQVNACKGTMTNDEFILICKSVASFTQRESEAA